MFWNYVRLRLDYYCVMSVVYEFRKDIAWIERDWSKWGALEHPFLEKVTASPGVLAKEVAQLYRNSQLSRALVMPSRRRFRLTDVRRPWRPLGSSALASPPPKFDAAAAYAGAAAHSRKTE
ncbi:unnamed protein product [Phytophthora fragariaefolia]|uniref:Unnamed protein product n=1 Tax=Phytophthora fragariaefolia TaxID=1490495 RepID=A0A9W6XWM9_9STRA|nr:unnamed protein product [Phytophthora fragariaefolia]